MTYWLDAHLDPALAPWLGATFRVVVKTLREVGLHDADDDAIFAAARRFRAIVIVTKDIDFADLVEVHGSPPQIIRLAFGNLRTIEMQIRLRAAFGEAIRAIESGEPLMVID